MTSPDSPARLTHAELGSTHEMAEDCRATTRHLRLERAVRRMGSPAPSIRFEDYPREVDKPTIEVSRAASRLAAAIHPYLD
jgi:hypothetical protein